MNNPSHYAFKLVCVDESNPLEYEVLEDLNAQDLKEVHNLLESKIVKYNINNTKWMLFPIPKKA